MENGSTTLTLLSIHATILERLTVALVTHTEVGLIGFNDTRKANTVHNTHEAITEFVSPKESGILVDTTDFSGLTNRESMEEAGDKLFPDGEVLFGVVENTVSGNGELFVTMKAIEARTTVLLVSTFSYAFSFCSTMRANDTIGKFRINNKLEVRRR